MVANSFISVFYYIAFLIYESEPSTILKYFAAPLHPFFIETIILAVVLAIASEYTGNPSPTQPTPSP